MFRPVHREIVRFASEDEAYALIDLLVPFRNFRVADYGADFEGHPSEPFWLAVDHLSLWEFYPPVQVERWKACGQLTH